MQRHVQNVLLLTLILLALGINVKLNAQPVLIADVPNNSANYLYSGGLVYFTAGDQLWRTDGTAAGTRLLRSGFEFDSFNQFKSVGSTVYFTNLRDPVAPYGKWKELWRTNGTSAGTVPIRISSEYDVEILDNLGSFLFYTATNPASGREVYKTNGSGTELLRDIQSGEGDGFVQRGAKAGNLIFFAADNGVHGTELWVTDGTSAGTVMAKDINPGAGDGFVPSPGSDIGFFLEGSVFAHNNNFYFTGNDPDHGEEPWISDGTTAGTALLKDITTGMNSTGPVEYKIAHDGQVYFTFTTTGTMGSYLVLWKTGGTSASTALIQALGEDHQAAKSLFRIYNGKVYFFTWASNIESYLWFTDGTAIGTQTIHSFTTHEGGVQFFEEVNGYLLFYGIHQGIPTPLFRTDGNSFGTEVTRFKSQAFLSGPRDLTVVNDLLFYADHDGPSNEGEATNPEDAYQLIQTDANTVQSVRSLHGGSYRETMDIVDFDGNVLFTSLGQVGDNQKKLWLYDPHGHTGYFTLVNADTDKDIQRINDGDVLTVSDNTNINIRFNPAGTPGSVVFNLNGRKVRTENAAPYALAGDVGGNYSPWAGANPGSYVLAATPYSESGGNGDPGTGLAINFTIQRGPDPGDCTASGTILREQWNNISGNQISAIPVSNNPSLRHQLTSFEGPTNSGTNYGARISGYICPPATGAYTFWIASNDHSELWLSTDDHPSNKVRIAYVTGATAPREWDKFTTQRSAPVTLTEGTRYYIEALHKQGLGTDNVAVGWQLPDGAMERPIPGNRLSPASANLPPSVLIVTPEVNQNFDAPATINIEATANDEDGTIALVEFFQRMSAFDEFTKIGEDATAPYQFTWRDVPAGRYQIQATATDDLGETRGYVISIHVNETCTASGTIVREYWSGVEGSSVSDIPFDTPPSSTTELTIFEGPSNSGIHYGARIRGYICPPVSGDYHFYISSNDQSELWLSSSHDPAGKRLIASVTGATGVRQWNKYASQASLPITLVQGQRYYVEALHKQGVGSDNLAVGWQLPDGRFERPISGSRLSPYIEAATTAGDLNSVSAENARVYSQIHVYPNPVPAGNAALRISGYEGIEETIETHVEIINLTGEVVYNERVRCGGDCSSYLMEINQQLVPGVYMVNMKTKGARFSKRLLVK